MTIFLVSQKGSTVVIVLEKRQSGGIPLILVSLSEHVLSVPTLVSATG